MKRVLVKKYARAFLKYGDFKDCSSEFILKLDSVVRFMIKNRQKFYGLRKESYLKFLVQTDILSSYCEILIELLSLHDRLNLFPEVLRAIRDECSDRLGISFCTIYSSHFLDENQREKVRSFIEGKSGKKIFYRYEVSEKLIAGVRVEGENFLWEDSIAQRLRSI